MELAPRLLVDEADLLYPAHVLVHNASYLVAFLGLAVTWNRPVTRRDAGIPECDPCSPLDLVPNQFRPNQPWGTSDRLREPSRCVNPA